MVDSTEVLHIYRRLLRAITYLPDSYARINVHNDVVGRFRKHRPRSSPEHITKNRVKRARTTAICLERAGHGDLDDLKKVLMQTHGRAGGRRRELIKDLLRPDESVLPKDDSAVKELIESPKAQEVLNQNPNPKVTAFIESQRRNHPKDSIKSKIRQLEIPKKTIWGHAPTQKLQDSMWRKWWAQTLDKLLPPVPQHEWDRLQDLALGKISLDEFPRRRSRPVEEKDEKEDMAYRYLQLKLRSEAAQIEGATFDPQRGLKVQTKTREEVLNENHRIPPTRARRRLYALIWSLTPTISQDEVTKKWTVTWGSGKSLIAGGTLTQPSTSDMELFEGLPSLPELQPVDREKSVRERRERQAARQARLLKETMATNV